MADDADDVKQELQELGVPESPATWENVAAGKAKELFGKAIGDEELAEAGEQQEEIAREVREEYRREHPS
ncbi:MAG: hypothetical protein M3Y42_03340 [Actinomycetota bacterium]|nr:hypothetical protein [Actinomycetota bacterium]MDQ2955983.1 hypothetical protein [Actinomycetota bacterium]